MNQEKQFQFDTMKKFLTMAEECERRAQEIEVCIKKVSLTPLNEREIGRTLDALRKMSQKCLSVLAKMSQNVSEGFMLPVVETDIADLEYIISVYLDEAEDYIKYLCK